MTIYEFARHCGVSPATVSRYFSNAASLSPELRERVEAAVKELNYRPSPYYQRRKKVDSNIIVIVMPHWKHHFSSETADAIQRHVMQQGRQLVALAADDSEPLSCLPIITRLAPLGVIVMHEQVGYTLPEALAQMGIPTVLTSVSSNTKGVAGVNIDDIAAAYDGTNYLIGLGHRSIGVISDYTRSISSGFQRIAGFKKAMEDAQLAVGDKDIVFAGSTFSDGYTGMEELLRQQKKYTAVFAFSDDMARGAMAALTDAGLTVPEDISILGFDDCSIAKQVRPPLTTIRQPVDDIARRSVELLLSGTDSISITLPHTIVQRKSCRAIKETREK